MEFREYNINGSKYDVKKLRHYTSIKSLLSILKLGYIRPHKSRGDKDYSHFITEEDMNAVSFLDSEIDTELDSILVNNYRQGTMENDTMHLALHMKTISAMIEIDLDKYETPEDVKLLGNYKYLYQSFINEWNSAIQEFQENLQNKLYLINLRQAYKDGGVEGYNSYMAQIPDGDYKSWLQSYRRPNDYLLNEEYAENDISTYERASKYKFKELTPEMAQDLYRKCEDADLWGVFRILRQLGIDKELLRGHSSDINWLIPQKIRTALGRFEQLLSDSKLYAPIELRSTNKVRLNKNNSTIYVFTGLAKGTGQDEFLPQLKDFENYYNIKYIEPGQGLDGNIADNRYIQSDMVKKGLLKMPEKMFRTAKRLTYEEAKRICRTPNSFLKYIRDNKDIYYTIGEFDKVEPALQYITDFVYGGKHCYKDYLDMIQTYFDEILPLGDDGDVDIYRGVRLNREEDFDWKDIGNCWTYEWDSCLEFLKYFTDDKKSPFILTASTDRDNIDWITSICLNLTHVNEKELRVYDVDKIEDPFLENADYYMDNSHEYIDTFEEKDYNRIMKKYRESTPLEDRDAYQSWKDERDDVESMSSKEKFSTELYNRNQKIYKVWCDMIEKVMRAGGFDSDGDGFDAFLDKNDPFLSQTGYYDSFSFCHSALDVHEYNSGGIGIGVYYKDGTEAGGYVFKDFIPKLKKTGGAELRISCLVCYDSDDMEDLKSEKQMMNLFTKYLLGEGRSRSQIASVIKFFNEIINGNGQVYFPGADSVGFYGLEDGRPSIMVTYSVSVTPTEEEIKNVVDCVRTMDREVISPLYW